MRPKAVLTATLLLFVALSVGVVIVREAATGSAPVARPAAGATPTGAVKPELVVFYLHGKVRCVTCNDIERSAREAVESGFGPEIQAGRVVWRVVDYEERGNEHYATDYKLAAPCVVLASMRDGHQVSWKGLPEVWELIGDKPAFREFVQKNVREQLGQGRPLVTAKAPQPTTAPSTPAVTAAKLPRLLDLGAGKCIPCKMMAPVLAELRETYKGRLEVVFIDVWEDSTPAQTYDVSTIPTQIFFDAQGKERFRHEGFFSREEILAKWKELAVDLGSPGRS